MTLFTTIDADCEAFGHPTECTEPATGTVVKTSDHSLTVTNAAQVTKQVATIDSADINFPSHSHDYDTMNGCHDDQSHTLDPDNPSEVAENITLNGSPLYLSNDGVATDPVTGGDVDIIDASNNNSVNKV